MIHPYLEAIAKLVDLGCGPHGLPPDFVAREVRKFVDALAEELGEMGARSDA